MYTNGTTNGIVAALENGKASIMGAALSAGRRRVADVSHTLTRAGAMAAAAERCNEAAFKLLALAYETDETGPFCNLNEDYGLRWVAWGRDGRYMFGLRATEADVLRLHVQRLEASTVPLFIFDRQRWWLNAYDYATLRAALAYWGNHRITGTLYKSLSAETSAKRRSGAK